MKKSKQERDNTSSKSRGAKASDISNLHLMSSWWLHHRHSCKDSLIRLLRMPIQSFLTWLVIAIAVALPAGLFLGLQNVQKIGQGWENNSQMSAFLKRKAQTTAIDQLVRSLEQEGSIDSVDLISPSGALEEFKRYSGLEEVLSSLDGNPLPAILVIQPSSEFNTPEKLSALRQSVAKNAIVDSVQMDMGWLRRLQEMLLLGQRLVSLLAGLLLIGVLLIIGNTLRLAIENRREEIIVTKLVGGTNAFVRRPFLYSGLWYGVGGGLMAIILLLVMKLWLSKPIGNLVVLYESDFVLEGFGLQALVSILLACGLLGWLSAWLAVSRHLRGIEPK
jgi:cell division transport system permease protein